MLTKPTFGKPSSCGHVGRHSPIEKTCCRTSARGSTADERTDARPQPLGCSTIDPCQVCQNTRRHRRCCPDAGPTGSPTSHPDEGAVVGSDQPCNAHGDRTPLPQQGSPPRRRRRSARGGRLACVPLFLRGRLLHLRPTTRVFLGRPPPLGQQRDHRAARGPLSGAGG